MASYASRAVCLLLVALALCQGAVAAPSMTRAEQIRGALVRITDKSDALRIEAAKINGLALFSMAKVAPGFTQITSEVSAAAAMLASTPPLGKADAKMVVVALKAFVRVHQALLDVVIGKSGLLAKSACFSTIREALVALEKAVDSFAKALIVVIPTDVGAADAQFEALGESVTNAQATYAQFAALRVTVPKTVVVKGLLDGLRPATGLGGGLVGGLLGGGGGGGLLGGGGRGPP